MGQRAILDKIMAKMEKSISTKNESQRRAAMSNWITDRTPKKKDAYKGSVWLCRESGWVDDVRWSNVILGEPWMRITPPPSYVKPKRYAVRYSDDLRCWVITINGSVLFGSCLFEPLSCLKDKNSDLHREAAVRIAAIYEEVIP